MEDLFANPLVQSAVVPFTVALVVALILRPVGRIAAGAGFAAAFAASAWLVMGLQFTPLTSTRKLVLAGGVAVLVGLALDAFLRWRWARVGLLAAGGAAAALWLAWPRLMRLDGAEMWLMAIPAGAYAAWLVASMDTLRERPEAQIVAVLSAALGTAVAAVLGASAMLGQLGGAVAAAAGAYALLFAIRGAWRPGAILYVPAATLVATVGLSAVIFARLPWYALVPLALIPVLAHLPLPARGSLVRLLVAALYTLPAAAATIALTWRETGAPPI